MILREGAQFSEAESLGFLSNPSEVSRKTEYDLE